MSKFGDYVGKEVKNEFCFYMKVVGMKRFSELKARFAKTLCRMMDYGFGREKSPRPLRIASVLLMSSAAESLEGLLNEIIFGDSVLAAIRPMTDVKRNDFRDVSTYVELLNSIGALSVAIVNYFNPTSNFTKEDIPMLTQIINDLGSSLKNIKDISESVKLRQGKNLYFVFEHPSIIEATQELLSNLERRGVVSKLKDRGVKDATRSIEKSMDDIARKIKYGEKISKMKERQGTPPINPNEDFDLVSGAA